MQRNWDTIRSILKRIEEEPGIEFYLYPKDFEPIYNDEAVYHLRLLHNAGLIEGDARDNMTGPPSFVVTGLTWEGHELLSAMTSSSIWKRVKETAGKKGIELSLDAIKLLVKAALKALVEG